MTTESSRFRRWMVSMLVVAMVVALIGLIRMSTVAHDNAGAINRLEHVEAEVRQIIDQSLLDCPNRAKARHVLRIAILNDQDTTPALRDLVNEDFKEISCDHE